MTARVKCVTLSRNMETGKPRITPGFPMVENRLSDVMEYVWFGVACRRAPVKVPVRSGGIEFSGRESNWRIIDADFDAESESFVFRRPEDDVYLVRLTTDAEFVLPIKGTKPQIVESMIWIGGDGPGLVLNCCDGWRYPYKDQLFRLRPDESFLVFDAQKRIVKVTLDPSLRYLLKFDLATPREIGDYALAWAGRRGADNRYAVGWARRIMEELGMQDHIARLDNRFGTNT